MLGTVCALLFLGSSASAVLYRPYFSPRMKNTTLRWNMKANLNGPNVCAREIVYGSIPRTYDTAWTGGALCVPTNVKFECCDGWSRVPGEQGCTRALDVTSVEDAATIAKAGWALRLMSSSGLNNYVDSNHDPVTIFLPDDQSASALSAYSRYSLENGASRASRLIDGPALLQSHIVQGRHSVKSFTDNKILTPIAGQPTIRINTYPNGLVTANCVPIVKRDILTKGPHLQILSSLLPQGYLFPVADTVLRDVQARRFASYVAQVHLESLLRTEGPFTVFVPTDSAMGRLSHHHVHALRYDDVGLRALVLNHVVAGVQCGTMLSNAVFTSKHGETLRARCRGTSNTIEGAPISAVDKMASNGVVHVIDYVLVPRRAKLIIDVLRDLGLTSLLNLVERGGLSSVFTSPDTFTIFAPTNEALTVYSSLGERDARLVLMNHMAPGRILTSSFKTSENVASKGTRQPFSISFLRNKVLVDGAVIIKEDVETLNGVIHVIDRILPEPGRKSILQYLREVGTFTHFLYSLHQGLPSVFSRLESPSGTKYTVFVVGDSKLIPSLYYRTEVNLMGSHVVEREVLSEQVPANGSLATPTLGGTDLVLARRGSAFYAGSAYDVCVWQRPLLQFGGLPALGPVDVQPPPVLPKTTARMGKPDKPPVKNKPEEVPWDLVDRCFLPVVFSHALAVILAFFLNNLYISQVSSFTLFILFLITSLAGVIFYHNLKVSAVGKVVVITSCDTKLGLQLVKQLDDLGFTVIAGGPKKNEELEKLKETCSARLHTVELDVRSDSQVQSVVEYVKSHLPAGTPGVWALINTANTASFGEVEWAPLGVYREAAEANLFSVVRTTQAFLPLVRKTKGRVITIVSLVGRVPAAVRAPYCATKRSVEALTDCLRLEMRRWGVDVVVVEPGAYTTGSLWFADNRLLQEARALWLSMNEDLRSEYGKDYFEFKIRQLEQVSQSSDVDLAPTLRSLNDAVVRTFPLSRYTPVTRAEKIQALVSDHLPRSVYDIIYS